MKRALLIVLLTLPMLCAAWPWSGNSQGGAGKGAHKTSQRVTEPSIREIEMGFKEAMFGNPYESRNNLKVTVSRIAYGKWSIVCTIQKNGERRTLNATAIMDKNGDIHYYTE